MIQALITRYKNYKKLQYLTKSYKGKYAFVGIGTHSINNLYPIINYLKINLKYIVTRSEKNAEWVDKSFANSIGTHDFDAVLNDNEINGVFICTQPNAHYQLVKKTLLANKNVFVEKPPCLTIDELKDLIKVESQSKGKCMVGFQKQYSPICQQLKEKISEKLSYNYRFITGSYPEGNHLTDLFIHPLSLALFLFGKIIDLKKTIFQTANAQTIFLHLIHENEKIGTLEFSTDYTWGNASEQLIINTSKNIYEVNNLESLVCFPKSGNIFGIPKEKVFKNQNINITLVQRNNFSPIFQNNQLYINGYYTEIENFIKICESQKGLNYSTLESCLSVYELIEKIKEVCTKK